MKYWFKTPDGIIQIDRADILEEGEFEIGDMLWSKGDKYTTEPHPEFMKNIFIRDDVPVYIGKVRDKGAVTPDYSKVPVEAYPRGIIQGEVVE